MADGDIIYRASLTPTVPASSTVKGSALTNTEIDGNFKSLSNAVAARPTTTQVQSTAESTALALAIALG